MGSLPSVLIRTIRQRPAVVAGAAAACGAAIMALVATWAVVTIEARTDRAVTSKFLADGITWAAVSSDGLRVRLTGTAPNEAARFRAVNMVGSLVDAGRIRDRFEVAALAELTPPRFSVEVLRNTDEISLIGLVPAADDGEAVLIADVGNIAGSLPVADMLETADYPAPEGWTAALDFGVQALRLLPRSKISVAADRVAITAISDSAAEKRRLEADLTRLAPAGLTLVIDISAPRPVLTPFTLRFVKDAASARFDACAADSDGAQRRILAAATAAGIAGTGTCTIGLGVPTPRWAEATEAGIRAVDALGGGTVTFADADVTLLAAPGTDQALYDRVVGELQAALPPVFSLNATLPPPPNTAVAAQGPAEFTAVLNAEGRVELRGRLTDQTLRNAVDSFARAQFGADAVYTATRLDADLPDGWPVRVLAGIDALSSLTQGTLLVRADVVEVSGVTGSNEARERIAQVLSGRLGPGQTFKVDVRYDQALDPLAALPTADQCVAGLNGIVGARKITFTPGSAEIDAAARGTLDALATLLKDCPGLAIEVAGHTDAQGSEGGNLALSQARAEAVLVALQGRRLPVQAFVAKGYGEASPIADNGSDEGREANRRIEFTLIGGQPQTAAPVAPVAPSDNGQADPASSQTTFSTAGSPSLVGEPSDTAQPALSGRVVADPPAAGPTLQVAAAPPVPGSDILGATRSITLGDLPETDADTAAPASGAPVATFAPSTETFRRPLRRADP